MEEFPFLDGTAAYFFHDFLPDGLIRVTSGEEHISVTHSELDENENIWEMLDMEQQWEPLPHYLRQES